MLNRSLLAHSRKFALPLLLAGSMLLNITAAEKAPRQPLDPRGKIHIPIGIANTVDTLKTFVEAEGNFSPGFGSYGIYFWLWDNKAHQLFAPTMDEVKCEHGLAPNGFLIPWSQWAAGSVQVKSEVCEVMRRIPSGNLYIAASRVQLTNTGPESAKLSLYAAIRPLGPAGWPIHQMSVGDRGASLLVDGHPALIAKSPSSAGVIGTDTIGQAALERQLPSETTASSASGDASGALRFDINLSAGRTASIEFICPVLPGRRAVGHHWDETNTWAQLDLAELNPAEGGYLQIDPGLGYYESLSADQLFNEAEAYFKNLTGKIRLRLPDPRWAESFNAIVDHAAMCMNEGAPDVAVINYNVFNRDGVYLANIFQKAGKFDLAEEAIDYFLGHPFSGRSQPEADNPGQILWIMGEHWKFTRSQAWLQRVYPAAQKIVALIRYYRTQPEPHWVSETSLEFGETLPPQKRKLLKPGACDGFHPEYTEAFDLAGLRNAIVLAEAMGNQTDAAQWKSLEAILTKSYDEKFGSKLAQDYGSYSVLWPCRLYPLTEGKAFDQFKTVGFQPPKSWRYFPLARAHQGLLARNREAGFATLNAHLDQELMKGWYALDEGGDSGAGGWNRVRTTWRQGKASDAMPHGWAMAEFQLLLRDSLAYEDGNRLVLLGGIPPEWFSRPEGFEVKEMPTHFGSCSLGYGVRGQRAILVINGRASPPDGFAVRIPEGVASRILVNGQPAERLPNGDIIVPLGTRRLEMYLSK